MTKKQRLAKLLKAAEMLQYHPETISGCSILSCLAVDYVFGFYFIGLSKERKAYNKAVGATRSAKSIRQKYTEQSQLARQLAVLMYREGIKRGKYD